jgi:hypothetical protein
MPFSAKARAREQDYAERLYRPDPAETTAAYRKAWRRSLDNLPVPPVRPDEPRNPPVGVEPVRPPGPR